MGTVSTGRFQQLIKRHRLSSKKVRRAECIADFCKRFAWYSLLLSVVLVVAQIIQMLRQGFVPFLLFLISVIYFSIMTIIALIGVVLSPWWIRRHYSPYTRQLCTEAILQYAQKFRPMNFNFTSSRSAVIHDLMDYLPTHMAAHLNQDEQALINALTALANGQKTWSKSKLHEFANGLNFCKISDRLLAQLREAYSLAAIVKL